MRNEPSMTALLAAGTESAWREIFRRYTPFVAGVCRRYRVYGADAEDVCGTVWLQLVSKVSDIRDPEALPAWLATTAGRECLLLLRDKRRQVPSETDVVDRVEPAADGSVLVHERHDAVRRACDGLPDRDRELLSMLFADPPRSYADISTTLGMPIGAIGPTRQRCLARVRRSAAIAALLDNDHRRSA
jgi:RNA polymerase sigma factor (sigma-70 family)